MFFSEMLFNQKMQNLKILLSGSKVGDLKVGRSFL